MEATTRTVNVDGYGDLDGEFEHNEHGWFCTEVNGIRWNYTAWGVQAASHTPEEAASSLLRYAEEDG